MVIAKTKTKTKRIIRRLNLVCLLTVVFFAVILFFIPSASAGILTVDENDLPHRMAKQVLGSSANIVSGALGLGQANMDDDSDIKAMSTKDGTSVYDSMNKVTDDILEKPGFAIVIIGGIWCIIVTVSRIFQAMERGQDPVESTFKMLLELTIACLIMLHCQDIINWVLNLGHAVAENIHNLLTGNSEDAAKQVKELLENVSGSDHGGIKWWIKAWAALLLPYILSLLLSLVAQFIVYSTILEIAIRKLFAPLAVADTYQDGMRSPGMRYFKKLFATILKLSAIMLIGYIAGMIISATGLQGASMAWGIIVINLTAIGIMFKCGEFINDAVGV